MIEKENLRIVYMGTPDFAVAPLAKLVESGYNVVCVITMPDKKSGRGMNLHYSPVKEYALSKNIPLLQPEKLKDPEFISKLESYNADLQIVVAFRMLPEVVWGMPPLGTFNLHASLLPQYRGAAPINWAVINGEKETGVTTFFLKHEIDTGNIIMQEKISIGPDEDVGSVHDRLMLLGSELVVKTVVGIINNEVHPVPQKTSAFIRQAPKLFKDNTRISWTRNVLEIYNLIRGLSPYPSAWTMMERQGMEPVKVKIFKTSYEYAETSDNSGAIQSDGKGYMKIVCRDGLISVKKIQLAGRKAMPVEDFLRGFKEIKKYNFK